MGVGIYLPGENSCRILRLRPERERETVLLRRVVGARAPGAGSAATACHRLDAGAAEGPSGAIVIALPHLIGAPHLDRYFGTAAPELGALFATRALGVSAVAWALLGLLAGWIWSREAA